MKPISDCFLKYGDIKKFSDNNHIGLRRVHRMIEEGNYFIHEGQIYKRVAKLNENNRPEETKNGNDNS